MRVLFSCTSGDGHFYPLVPLAQAMRQEGHDVVFAMAPGYASRVEGAGFGWVAAGVDVEELDRRWFTHLDELRALPRSQQLAFSIARRFALGDAPQRAADLHRIAASRRPDLVVFEPCDLAAPVVAASGRIPMALHSFGRALPASCYEASMPFVASLWQEADLAPAPLCGMYGGAYVDICPPSLHSEPPPVGTSVLQLRPTSPPDDGHVPPWLLSLPVRPTVYVTLGTMWNDVERFRLVLEAVDGLDCNVIMTIGSGNDPAQLGAVPANTRVERFVPQALVLPRADAVVAHGGSGSMLAALAHGLPMLLLPRGADQFGNAEACQAAGVARSLLPHEVTAASVRAALLRLLADAGCRDRARGVAAEIREMPDPAQVATALTGLASAGAG